MMKILERLTKRSLPDPNEKRREFFKKRCTELVEQLRDIRTNYDFVTDPRSIDALIYAENAAICQLETLIKDAKAEGISIQHHERLK